MRKIILLVAMFIGLTTTAQERKVEYKISFNYNLVEYVVRDGEPSRIKCSGKVVFLEYNNGDTTLHLEGLEGIVFSLSHVGNYEGYSKYQTPEGVTYQDVTVLLYYNVLKIRINSSYFNYYINGYTELVY